MKRDWRPTLALIAALLMSLVLVWLGREVGTHIERDAALISQLTREDPRLGSRLHFGRALAPVDARYVDASATADAGTTDAYEPPDLAAPVIRRYCDAVVNRVCSVWSACGCEGTPPRWPFDETEVGSCAELLMSHCESWHVWGEFRGDLARSPVIIDEAALIRFETDIAELADCNGIRVGPPELLMNNGDVGELCDGEAAFKCRDGSGCIDGVCTQLPRRGERCLGDVDERTYAGDRCRPPGLCGEGLICSHHRCIPREGFDCSVLEECGPDEVYNWSDEVAHTMTTRSFAQLIDQHHILTPVCMPIGRSCTRDIACVRGLCEGERIRVCLQPKMHEHHERWSRTVAALDGYQGDDDALPIANVGEECRSHICAQGLSCSPVVVNEGESTERVTYVCRQPADEGARCEIDSDCLGELVCVAQVRDGHCGAPVCQTEPLFH